ncbi:MAG: DUF4340 domain-containing protein [Epulopiscium sp.]|nr:DUF4340 domain-containing protein [Candidatus Epulonipiscium sp.]
MKKSKNIILALVLLGVLVGTYIYISSKPEEEKLDNNVEKKEEITNISKDSINKMMLISNEEELIFERRENDWILYSREDLELDQNIVDTLASSFAILFAERVVEENPEDLEKYGLNTPVVTARAILSDGSEKVYYLGNKTPEGNTYYLMVKDVPKVYTVWVNHGNNFSLKMNDVRLKALTEIALEEIKYFYLKQEGKPTIEIIPNEDESGKDYGWGLWLMKQPYRHEYTVDTEDFTRIIQGVSNLKIKDFVEENPSDISKYGLDNPKIEIKIQDNKNTLHLYIGSNKDESTVYFKTHDKNNVYTMDILALTPFINSLPFELIDRFAYIVDINLVDAIKVETREGVYDITFLRTTKRVEDEEDEIVTTYRVDGEEIEESKFKSYYQKLIGITLDAEIDKTIKKEDTEISTIFILNTGETIVINYVPYNKDFYAVLRDNESEFVVTKKKVKDMLEHLEGLIEGN